MAGAPYLTWKAIDEAFDRACARNPYYAEQYRELQADLRVREQERRESFEFGTAEYSRFSHEYIIPIYREMDRISTMIRCRHSQKYLTDDGVCRKCGAEVWRNLDVSHASIIAEIPA